MADEAGANWELWRQDDNGNRFLVAKFPSAKSAQVFLERLGRGFHKQHYWIVAPQPDRAGPPQGQN